MNAPTPMGYRLALVAVAMTVLWLTASGDADAHHSFGMFDVQSRRTIEGKVVEFEWTNPHTWAWVDVENEDGTVTRWGLEGRSPNYLNRNGWTKRTLQPGDRVTMVVSPVRTGQPGGALLSVTLPDGTEKVMYGNLLATGRL